jgi:hypothetical protein
VTTTKLRLEHKYNTKTIYIQKRKKNAKIKPSKTTHITI